MLLGQFEANLVDGNRLAVPKKLREELGSNLVIARWYENCLVLVSSRQWANLLTRLTGRSTMITQNVRDTDRFILGSAYELTADSQGRVVIPASLIKFANIESEAIFLGLGDRVEIWNKKNWIAREDYVAQKGAELIENLAKESREKKMHEPVLLKEAIEILHVKSQEWYIDATLGAAGHTIEILKQGGNVLGIDQDPSMLEIAKNNIEEALLACPTPVSHGGFKLLHGNFSQIDELAQKSGIKSFKGILFDLGVSNFHYLDKARGFSFSDSEAPLDMRLDANAQGVQAKDLLNGLREDQLHELFEVSMEYPKAKQLAKRVVEKRKTKTFAQMGDFLSLFNAKASSTHPSTQGLMALRIAVNSELDNIQITFPKAFELLEVGGRLAVITFHSTEDKIVKHIFQNFVNEGKASFVTKDSIVPSLDELNRNKKARSARLRAIEKTK